MAAININAEQFKQSAAGDKPLLVDAATAGASALPMTRSPGSIPTG